MKTKNKNSNLKLVNNENEEEAKRRAQTEERKREEESWKLTRSEITARVRAMRLEFESARERLEGMPFDVVTGDTPHPVDYVHNLYPIELVDQCNPCVKGRESILEKRIGEKSADDIFEFKSAAVDTAFTLGVFAGAIFAGCSDREIDRLERGLVHATVSRPWRVKE